MFHGNDHRAEFEQIVRSSGKLVVSAKSPQDALPTTFSVFLDIFSIPPIVAILRKVDFFNAHAWFRQQSVPAQAA
jgi:hypothetical protein